MDKVLIEIVCAATEKTYDFLLPQQMKVKTALRKIMEQIMIFEENGELFSEEKEYLLVEKERQEVLNEEFTLEQAGISGGNRLILI